jgi:hypothetical protein
MATVNGAVGWVGLIFVAPTHRGRGIGRELTAAAIDALGAAGCRTMVLVATSMGRPLYERLGFEHDRSYQTYAAPALPSATPDGAIRELRPDDGADVVRADRLATGEDRSALVTALLEVGTGWVLEDRGGAIRAHLLRPPWGGGSTIAPDLTDALAILQHRRRVARPDATIRCGIVEGNEAGKAMLEAAGWTHYATHPRLVRGEPIDWRPAWIWGQLNFALG